MLAHPFSLSELWLFAGSIFGLLLVPAALRRAAWIFPAWFAGLGLFLLAAPASLHPERNVWVWLLLSQGPWIFLVPDLFARGRAARALDAVPLRPLLAWSLLHLLAGRHVFSALAGELPPDFALSIASGEVLTALGALVLWIVCRPEKTWFRILAMFWNAQAFAGSLAWSLRLLRAHGGLPAWGSPAPELHAYFAAWPGSLEAFFWIPVAIGLHAAIFYKLLIRHRGGAEIPVVRFSGEKFQ